MNTQQTNTLQPGDLPPALELRNHEGTLVSLSDFAGVDVIVYFYPKAFTPGCTTEACDFRDNLAALSAAGVTVLGVSSDPVEKLAEFHQQYGLNFTLLSDPDATTAQAWGAWGMRSINGVESEGALRSTMVIGPDQRVRRAEYRVDVDGHVAELSNSLLGS